jgi:hypothetical protein
VVLVFVISKASLAPAAAYVVFMNASEKPALVAAKKNNGSKGNH